MAETAKVAAVYFSATGTTKRVIEYMAGAAAEWLRCPLRILDFTLPQSRMEPLRFSEDELVFFGVPVYAGRVPNVLLKFLDTLQGGGAAAVPVVLFGNRDFDDALIELRDILGRTGFYPFAAAAFVGEHAFSETLAAGRPDETDMAEAEAFARRAADRAGQWDDVVPLVEVSGVAYPYRGYYQPRDSNGAPVDIRRVKPRVSAACTGCGVCAALCPMGSISGGSVPEVTGICIKCGACVKGCPQSAMSFTDPAYLHHRQELEEGLARRAVPKCFL